MSSLPDRERQIRKRLKDEFEHYAPRCLRIRTKSGEVTPFALNRSQRYLHQKLEEQRQATGKVRALVLKGRQVGISTYISGRFYWRVTHSKGIRAFILTHLDTASDNLFGFAKRFHENCPALVKPTTGHSNAKELSFSKLDSGYKVATAGSAEVGRSETIQLFHGSEMAFWPNAEKHSAGIRQAIADVEGTEDIRESTANGIGNSFHVAWKAAERGNSEFMAVFIPWFWHEEYVRAAPEGWEPPPDWAEYERVYELSREQTYWAWHKNRDMAPLVGGTPDTPCWQFRQEYPANADEAFQTSGENAFIDPELVVKARKAKVEGYGPIIVGVDPARGGGDKTGIIDRQGRRIGGHICKRIDYGDLMAVAGQVVREVRAIGNVSKVVVDVTGLGAGLYDRLRETLGDIVEPVNFGERALERDKYSNRRAEIWDKLREWFSDPAGVQIPDLDELHGDLTAPVRGNGATRFDSVGRLVLESKDHIKERVGFSPDLGDGAALTFAVDVAASAVVWEDSPSGGGWMAA